MTDPRPSTACTTFLPRKRAETSNPPSTDWRADRAVVVVAKAPTAKPPAAPTVAPSTNLVVPWPKSVRPSGSPELRRRKFSTAPMVHGYTWQGMMETGKRDLLRNLPAVDAVMRNPSGQTLAARHGRASATAAVREALVGLRRQIVAGERPEVSEGGVTEAASMLLTGRGLGRVVNATGVLLHTNLGRSVLSERAALAAYGAATRYSNLEYDLRSGSRGSRYDHAVPLLRELTGAEDALVVNNCAGATLLALCAVVAGVAGTTEVVVSRGQLIEIGGGF